MNSVKLNLFRKSLIASLASISFFSGVQAKQPTEADVQQTRLGVLQLENGYPSKATAAKLYDELDFQRATQAYLWALPAVGFKALYDAQAKTFGARNGDVVLYQTLKDKAGMLTPNITTLYAFSFWDLAKQGPLVIEVPAGLTAGGVLDIWQQPITDMGQTGPDKGAGGKFLILPPGSSEPVAPGYSSSAPPAIRSGSPPAALIPTRPWPKPPCAATGSTAGTSGTTRPRTPMCRWLVAPGSRPSPPT